MFDPLPNPSNAPLILVIDDEPKNIQVVGPLLLKHGYEVVGANNAATALAKLETITPDLILLDVMMPGMTGFELSRHLKMNDLWKNIPIVFLSAASDKDFIVNALEAGGVDYLTKPFHSMELITRLQVHLNLQTTRKRLSATLRERNNLLEVVAHDLKNPLGGIRFAAAMMAENDTLDDRTKVLVDSISDSTDRAFEIVNNLLQTRRLEEAKQRLERHPLDLPTHVERAVRMFDQHGKSKNIRIETAVPPRSITIQADPSALMCSLENLISNAIKFSPKGSVVRVCVDHNDAHGIFTVEDEGPGISKEEEQLLFQKFTRLSARPTHDEASTGLGLYIVNELMQAMGGIVKHRPSHYGGACFEIHLPLSEENR
ncbi:MAG: hybrid sensor histidine kinase/response regulator [Luteolibacter sp.]